MSLSENVRGRTMQCEGGIESQKGNGIRELTSAGPREREKKWEGTKTLDQSEPNYTLILAAREFKVDSDRKKNGVPGASA